MEQITDIILRSILAFTLMIIIARILGKTTISQMTYHDFVAAITLGAITANLAFNVKMTTVQLLASLFTFSLIAFVLLVWVMKNRTIRRWVSGHPTILIEDGKILEHNMKKMRFTLDTLNQELREKNIFNISEVQYAVLELNGKVSALLKPEHQPVKLMDLHIKSHTKQNFPIEIIMDGDIIEDNLKQNNLDRNWLISQIKSKGLLLEQVNYAVKSSNGQMYFDLYEDQLHNPIDKE